MAGVAGHRRSPCGPLLSRPAHRPDSDWDFGLYYEDTIGPSDVEALGWPGDITGPRGRERLVDAGPIFAVIVDCLAHLDEGLDPGLAARALCDNEDPDGLDGAVSRLGTAARSTTQSRSGDLDGIEARPKLFRTSSQAVDPQRSINGLGQPRVKSP
jgi:hypothetical protein